MDYRQRLIFSWCPSAVLLVLMLVLTECPHWAMGQGQQFHHRLEETQSSSSSGFTSVQNNVKINIETSVRNSNEDKVLVHQHQQQKGQRQRLGKHGNEIIINPSLRVSPFAAPVIAINRL